MRPRLHPKGDRLLRSLPRVGPPLLPGECSSSPRPGAGLGEPAREAPLVERMPSHLCPSARTKRPRTDLLAHELVTHRPGVGRAHGVAARFLPDGGTNMSDSPRFSTGLGACVRAGTEVVPTLTDGPASSAEAERESLAKC